MAPDDLVLCATCGVERTGELPEFCPICDDERQYLPVDPVSGREVQHWTTLGAETEAGRRIEIVELEPGLWGLTSDGVGIGQQAKLIQTSAGNVLVDVPPHIDGESVKRVRELGGISAIIATHPHMYGVQVAWSRAFDDAPVFVSGADRGWLGRTTERIVVWSGKRELLPGVVASQPGGHFPGSVVVRFTGADGLGVLLTGDTVAVTARRHTVTLMRSYPNKIPLSAAVVRRVADHVLAYDFDRLYDNFTGVVDADAHQAVADSAELYIGWVSGKFDHLSEVAGR